MYLIGTASKISSHVYNNLDSLNLGLQTWLFGDFTRLQQLVSHQLSISSRTKGSEIQGVFRGISLDMIGPIHQLSDDRIVSVVYLQKLIPEDFQDVHG